MVSGLCTLVELTVKGPEVSSVRNTLIYNSVTILILLDNSR